MLLFFFFQAEDGIRDIGVTGVQTCALPIYPPVRIAALSPASFVRYAELGVNLFVGLRGTDISELRGFIESYRATWQAAGHRSEERRVGKECRSRWSPYH